MNSVKQASAPKRRQIRRKTASLTSSIGASSTGRERISAAKRSWVADIVSSMPQRGGERELRQPTDGRAPLLERSSRPMAAPLPEPETVPVIFSHGVEALFVKALGPRIDAACRERLRQVGLDLDSKLLPAYPLDVIAQCTDVVARSVFPDRTLAEARWLMGEAQVVGYGETLIGRAVLSILRLLPPRLILDRLGHAWRSGNNFTQTKVRELSPNECELWVNRTGFPELSQGLIATVMRLSGHPDAQVRIESVDGPSCTYRVSWPQS